MNQKLTFLLFIVSVVIIQIGLYACGDGKQSKEKVVPAEVENQVKEESLSTVRLSPQAEQRLGVATEKVILKNIPKTINIGGEIIAPPGQQVSIAAPVAGTLLARNEGGSLQAGSLLEKGQEVMRLLIMPPEKELLSAQEEVNVMQIEYEVALSKAKRAEQLLQEKAISEKSFEETQAQLARAKAALNAAKGRLDLLRSTNLDAAAGNLSTLTLDSPLDGVLQKVFVAPGQTIPATTIMFEVASLTPLWIRVPVYIGYLPDIDHAKDAMIIPMSSENKPEFFYAKPIQGPLLSDVNNASSDIYYELPNTDRLFRIGQKVSVILTQKSSAKNLVVPRAAVVYDMYGGNWVYVKVGPQAYSRHRVVVSHIVDDLAIVTRGVVEGDEVVYAGTAEIFGTEFGGGK